jgi:hypothetical protein
MFANHHRFANCERLEGRVIAARAANTVPDTIYNNYKLYHYSLIHKLKSARDNIDSLKEQLTTTPPQDIVNDAGEYLYLVNRSIDGFFYTSGSALDILAREVLTYYGIVLPDRVYFQTALKELAQVRPGDTLLPRLEDPPWKEEFSTYRNTLTHELLIVSRYSLNVVMDGPDQSTAVVFPLPDDPRVDMPQRTYRRNKDVLSYCNETFRKILSVINQIYGDLATKIEATNSLPI